STALPEREADRAERLSGAYFFFFLAAFFFATGSPPRVSGCRRGHASGARRPVSSGKCYIRGTKGSSAPTSGADAHGDAATEQRLTPTGAGDTVSANRRQLTSGEAHL